MVLGGIGRIVAWAAIAGRVWDGALKIAALILGNRRVLDRTDGWVGAKYAREDARASPV